MLFFFLKVLSTTQWQFYIVDFPISHLFLQLVPRPFPDYSSPSSTQWAPSPQFAGGAGYLCIGDVHKVVLVGEL